MPLKLRVGARTAWCIVLSVATTSAVEGQAWSRRMSRADSASVQAWAASPATRYARALGVGRTGGTIEPGERLLTARTPDTPMTRFAREAATSATPEAFSPQMPDCPMPVVTADSAQRFSMRATPVDSMSSRWPAAGRLVGCRNPLAR